jgi:hypothetical protein
MKNLQEKLESMIGKLFVDQRTSITHRMLSHKYTGQEFTLVTDKEWFTKHESEGMLFLSMFFPVKEDGSTGLVAPNDLAVLEGSTNIKKMSNLLFENIEKMKQDAKFVDTAKEINNHMNTLINLTKLQIQIAKGQ